MYSFILVSAHHLAYTCSLFLQSISLHLFSVSTIKFTEEIDQIDLIDHEILHAEIPPAIDEIIYPPHITFIYFSHEGNWITC